MSQLCVDWLLVGGGLFEAIDTLNEKHARPGEMEEFMHPCTRPKEVFDLL